MGFRFVVRTYAVELDKPVILLHKKLMEFRWNEWNVEHIESHGVDADSAEEAVAGALRPFPRKISDEKWLIWGRDASGRLLQVIFVLDDDDAIFVIHARPLSDREKKRFRRRKK